MLISSTLDLSEALGDTGLLRKTIIDALSNHEDFKLFLENNSIQSISANLLNDQGFRSKAYKIVISSEKDTFSCILKITTEGASFHNRECKFVEYFSKSCLPMPKYYAYREMIDDNDKGAYLLMEDLSSYQMLDDDEGFSYDQIHEIFKHLMEFHAFQLNHKTSPCKNEFKLNVEEDGINLAKKKKILLELKEINPGMSSYIDLVMPFLNQKFEEFILERCCDFLGLPKTINHNDSHQDHFFWKSNTELKAYIDFGLVYKGNPMIDFAQILSCSLRPTKKLIEKEFIPLYVDYLKTHVPDLRIDIEQVKKAYDLAWFYHNMNGIYWDLKSIKYEPEDSIGCTENEGEKRKEEAYEEIFECIKEVATYLESDTIKEFCRAYDLIEK